MKTLMKAPNSAILLWGLILVLCNQSLEIVIFSKLPLIVIYLVLCSSYKKQVYLAAGYSILIDDFIQVSLKLLSIYAPGLELGNSEFIIFVVQFNITTSILVLMYFILLQIISAVSWTMEEKFVVDIYLSAKVRFNCMLVIGCISLFLIDILVNIQELLLKYQWILLGVFIVSVLLYKTMLTKACRKRLQEI